MHVLKAARARMRDERPTFGDGLTTGGRQVTAEMAFPLPDHVSAPVVAAVISVIVGICPIITIICTHPFVAEYEDEASSPTGFILSYGSIFWFLLLCPSFFGVLWAFSDDERRVVIDAHPKLVAHVTDRVAADLAQVAPPPTPQHPPPPLRLCTLVPIAVTQQHCGNCSGIGASTCFLEVTT